MLRKLSNMFGFAAMDVLFKTHYKETVLMPLNSIQIKSKVSFCGAVVHITFSTNLFLLFS